MTPLTRPLARETLSRQHSAGINRAIVVELDPAMPTLIGFRLKGTRRTYRLPIDHCFREAMRNELARVKAERKRERERNRRHKGE